MVVARQSRPMKSDIQGRMLRYFSSIIAKDIPTVILIIQMHILMVPGITFLTDSTILCFVFIYAK